MAWIRKIEYKEAGLALKRIYNKVKGPDDNVDNVLMIHSLRPHTLKGHMTLYKSVLHNVNNTLPKWYLESIGVYISHLNKCKYCVEHHLVGLSKLWNDRWKAEAFYVAIKKEQLEGFFNNKFDSGVKYARKLTFEPDQMTSKDIEELRTAGFDDGEILEINQVTSYFNYVNRTVLGLGVNTDGDIIGLSPNDSSDPQNWTHQ